MSKTSKLTRVLLSTCSLLVKMTTKCRRSWWRTFGRLKIILCLAVVQIAKAQRRGTTPPAQLTQGSCLTIIPIRNALNFRRKKMKGVPSKRRKSKAALKCFTWLMTRMSHLTTLTTVMTITAVKPTSKGKMNGIVETYGQMTQYWTVADSPITSARAEPLYL